MKEPTAKAAAWRKSLGFVVILSILIFGYAALGFALAIVLAVLVSIVCGVLAVAGAIKGGFRDEPPAGSGLRWSAAVYGGLAQLLIGGVIAGALFTIAFVVVFVDVFNVSVSGGAGERFGLPILIALVLIVAAAAASFFLAFSLATVGPTTAAEALRRLGRRWFAVTLAQLGAATILGLAALFAISAAVGGLQALQVVRNMRLSSITGAGDLMLELIELPMLLIAAAALFAVHGAVNRGLLNFLEEIRKEAAAGVETQVLPDGPRRAAAAVIAAAVLLGGYASLGFVRIGLDGADSSVPMIVPVLALEDAVDKWLAEEAAKGVDGAALARRLNEAGHYRSEAPSEGIVELLPDLRKSFGKFVNVACRFDGRFGVRNMAEQTAIDKAYRTAYGDGEGDDNFATKSVSPVRYCLKAVCDGSMFRGSRPATWLVSSHPSANEGWIGSFSTSVIFNRIISDGGYCTKDGALSERYLG